MLDIVVRATAGVEEGTDVAGTIRFRVGGSAANTARAFAGLGGAATFVGALGSDSIARRLVAAMRAAGVTVRGTPRSGLSPRLVALVTSGGERSFVTDRGVADDLRPMDVKPAWIESADALHMPAYSLLALPMSESAVGAATRAHAAAVLVSVDLASSRPLEAAGVTFVDEQLGRTAPDVIFANADETATLVGRRGAARLLNHAPVAVIKEGSAGCRVLWRGDTEGLAMEIDVATKPLAATDTTGAGDAFDAGFLYSLIGAGFAPGSTPSAAVLRRAALAGHRAAARLLLSPRAELAL